MIRFSRRHGWWLTALAVFILVGGLRANGQLQSLENAAADMRARLMLRDVRSDIVIVDIDAFALQRPAGERRWQSRAISPWYCRSISRMLPAPTRRS